MLLLLLLFHMHTIERRLTEGPIFLLLIYGVRVLVCLDETKQKKNMNEKKEEFAIWLRLSLWFIYLCASSNQWRDFAFCIQ